MPRITADSVQEHVARQEAAVIDAAIRLFNEHGVADVGLAEIASEVGLARNSLYRYFPDKAHILAAWFRRTIAPLIDESEAIAAHPGPAAERVTRWADAQLDYLVAPEHAAMLLASSEMERLPEDVRAELGAGHRALYGSLARILDEASEANEAAGSAGRDLSVVTLLIASMVRGAAEQVRSGVDVGVVRDELRRSVLAVATA